MGVRGWRQNKIARTCCNCCDVGQSAGKLCTLCGVGCSTGLSSWGLMEWVTCSSISGWDGVTCSRHGSVTIFYVIDGTDRHFCVQVESHASYAKTG